VLGGYLILLITAGLKILNISLIREPPVLVFEYFRIREPSVLFQIKTHDQRTAGSNYLKNLKKTGGFGRIGGN
jgi:hypothetical protein